MEFFASATTQGVVLSMRATNMRSGEEWYGTAPRPPGRASWGLFLSCKSAGWQHLVGLRTARLLPIAFNWKGKLPNFWAKAHHRIPPLCLSFLTATTGQWCILPDESGQHAVSTIGGTMISEQQPAATNSSTLEPLLFPSCSQLISNRKDPCQLFATPSAPLCSTTSSCCLASA